MRRFVARTISVLLGVGAALVGLEVVLRVGGAVPLQRNPLSGFHVPDARLGWRGAEEYSARFRGAGFDVVIASEADGFRRPGHGVEPLPDAPAVVFLGDSFTWGWGVPQGAVFTDRLQAELGPGVRIVNRGVNAFGTGQELLLLERLLATGAPAAVTLMFYRNDLVDNGDPKGGRRPWFRMDGETLVLENCPVERRVSTRLRDVTRRSRALSLLRYETNRLGERLRSDRGRGVAAEGAPAGPSDAEYEERWRLQRALLAAVRDRCAAADVDFRVVYVTANFDLLQPDRASVGHGAIRQRLAELCAALGVDFLDPTPAFRAAWEAADERGPNGEPLFLSEDEHWAAAGHALMARELIAAGGWPSPGGDAR